jgi:hypothetical protein
LCFEEKGRDVRSTLNIMPSIVLVTGTRGRKGRGGGEGESESGADPSTSNVAALHIMNMWSGWSFLEREGKNRRGDERC